MSVEWDKPQKGSSIFQMRKDGKFCVRRDVIGWDHEKNKEIFSYILLKRKGAIWQQVGFTSANEAMAHADNYSEK